MQIQGEARCKQPSKHGSSCLGSHGLASCRTRCWPRDKRRSVKVQAGGHMMLRQITKPLQKSLQGSDPFAPRTSFLLVVSVPARVQPSRLIPCKMHRKPKKKNTAPFCTGRPCDPPRSRCPAAGSAPEAPNQSAKVEVLPTTTRHYLLQLSPVTCSKAFQPLHDGQAFFFLSGATSAILMFSFSCSNREVAHASPWASRRRMHT